MRGRDSGLGLLATGAVVVDAEAGLRVSSLGSRWFRTLFAIGYGVVGSPVPAWETAKCLAVVP